MAQARGADHVQGLLDWVSVVADENCERLEELQDGRLLGRVLQTISASSGPPLTTLDAVVHRAETLLETKQKLLSGKYFDDPAHHVAEIIQVLLGYAVQGPRKEASVAQIMDLESGTQHFLMVEVDQALKKIASARELPPPSPMDSPFTPAAQRSSNRRLLLDNENLQRQVEDHANELARLQQENREALRRRELELEDGFQEAQAALTASLEAKTAQVTQLQASLDQERQKSGDLGDLRDQLEVLRSQARESSKKDATIAKLREKVNASADLAQRVAELERANEQLLAKNLDAEQKAQDAAKLRADLQTCKNALVEAQIKANETRVLLDEKAQEASALRDECDALRRNETATLEENRSLQSSLAAGGDEDNEPVQMLGISELNPEVREELETLRKETARLRHELSSHSEENLSKLRVEADSLGGINDRLQRDLREAVKRGDQWQAEAGRLDAELAAAQMRAQEDATRHAAALAEAEMRAQEDAARHATELDEAEMRAQEDAARHAAELAEAEMRVQEDATRHATELAEVELRAQTRAQEDATRHAAELVYLAETSEEEKLAALLAEETCSAARIDQLVEERLELEAELLQTQASLEEYKTSHSASNEQLEALRVDLAAEQTALAEANEAFAAREQEFKETQSELEETQSELESRVAALESQIDHGMARLNQEHESRVAAEKQCEKFRLKAGELNYQANQLRRQLKSVQVQRSQASGGEGGGGGPGGEELVNNMKRLADQNERLLADNAQLRERVQTAGGASASRPSKGVSEMVRNYETEIQDLQKQMHMLTMAKTSELMARKEAENRVQKLVQSNEDLTAENTSLRLKLERSAKNFQQQVKPPPLRERNLNKHDESISSGAFDQAPAGGSTSTSSDAGLGRVDEPQYSRQQEASLDEHAGEEQCNQQ